MALKEGLARLAALSLREEPPPCTQEPPPCSAPFQLHELPPDALGSIMKVRGACGTARRAAPPSVRRTPHQQPTRASAPPPLLQLLSVADIHNLLQASRGLNEALQNDSVWHSLCAARWGAVTDLQRWLVPPLPPATPGTSARATLPLPQTYRQVAWRLQLPAVLSLHLPHCLAHVGR